jgi:hypothetical protein
MPTGSNTSVATWTMRGALLSSNTGESVQSGRPKRSAPRSDWNDGSSEVNTRGSRSSEDTATPGRGGRWSYLSGSLNVWRAPLRDKPPAQLTRGAVAPESKGLS